MNKPYKKTLKSTKYSLALLGLVVISLLFVTFSSSNILDFSSFDFQSYAAVIDGEGEIAFSTSSSDVAIGSEQEIGIFATTNDRDVAGFQLLIELEGTIPENIEFVPNDIAGLGIIRNNKTENNTIEIAFVAPPGAPFVPFSASESFELGKVTYTAPDEDGALTVGFNSESTIIIEYGTNQDIAKIPSSITHSFVAPEPSPSPSPTPTVEPSPSPSPTPTVEPSPSPSPTPTVEPSPSPSPTPTVEPNPSPSPTPTVEPSPSPSPTPTVEPSPSPSPTPTVEPSPSPTPTPNPGDHNHRIRRWWNYWNNSWQKKVVIKKSWSSWFRRWR